jgi:peptide/nickel transport system substrate-binding protein
VKDTAARLAELKAGSLDAMRDFSPLDIPTVKADARLRIVPRPPFNLGYIGLNLSAPPFNDLRVREALAHAIDEGAVIRALYAGEGSPATQFLVPGMLGFDDSVTDFRPYDPARAKDLLAQAGYPSGFATELWYMPVSRPYYPENKKIAEVFASYLGKIGVTTTLQTADWTTYRARARENKLPIWLFGWIGDNGDPDNFLNVFFHPKVVDGKETATEFGAWVAPEVWQLLRKAQTETQAAVRADLYKQVSRIVHKEIPRIPILYAKPPTATTARVRDYVPHPSNAEPFTGVWMER